MKKLLLLLLLIPNLVMGDNNSEKSVGWIYKGEVLHPYCFQKQWASSDNIQQYYEQFTGIKENYYDSKEFDDFSMNIGKYWGNAINSYEPIKVDWGEAYEEGLEYAVSMKSCLNKKTEYFEITENGVTSSYGEPTESSIDGQMYYQNEYEYKVIKEAPLSVCQDLAPYIDGKCEESFLLKIAKWDGGSRGHMYEYSIFGLFKLSSNEGYIFPLKKFEGQKEAESFIGE